ncbi:MAG: hypothetical protein WAO55_01810 [Candidatus Manganitrophaceae bacterium]
MTNNAKYLATRIEIKSGFVKVYASPRIKEALAEVTKDMTLYKGVRLSELLEAIYIQGKKDGARIAFEEIDKKLMEVKKMVPHKNPGQPSKKKY